MALYQPSTNQPVVAGSKPSLRINTSSAAMQAPSIPTPTYQIIPGQYLPIPPIPQLRRSIY